MTANQKAIEDLKAKIELKQRSVKEIDDAIMKRYREDIQDGAASDSVRKEFEIWAADQRAEQSTLKAAITRMKNDLRYISGKD